MNVRSDPSLEQMAAVLDNAKMVNGVLRAGCPAHGGTDQNLSVRYKGEKPLITCHSHHCSFTEVMKAIRQRLGEESSESVPIRRPSKESKPYPSRPAQQRNVAQMVWELKDAEGNLVARHVRQETPSGKKVIWRMPDGSWKLDRHTSELPLYGAEIVRKVPWNAPIVVTEGEKAADALRAQGFWAVGTVTGASGLPNADALSILKNRPIVLWPDNDQAGYEHMGRVAEGLVGVASEIRWLEWEGAPEKGDAADHPSEGLAELIADAPRWSKPPAIEGRAFLGQAITGGVEPPEELLPDMLLAGKAHNVYAPGGVGKTWLLVWIANELIKRGRKVAIFDLENGLRTYAERFEEMGADPATLDEYVYYWPFPRLDSARYSVMLEEEQPDLVMFDSWIGFLASEGRDENVSNDISMWAESYLKPALRQNSGVLLLDHVPHEHERERGSSRKRDEMDVVWQLTKVGDFDRESTATLVCGRMKDREGWLPERLTFEIGGDPESGFQMRRDDSLARNVEVTHLSANEREVLTTLEGFGAYGATTAEWLAALNTAGAAISAKQSLHKVRRKLVEKKKVVDFEGRYVAVSTQDTGVYPGISEVYPDTGDIPLDREAPGGVSGVPPLKRGSTHEDTPPSGKSRADEGEREEEADIPPDESREY